MKPKDERWIIVPEWERFQHYGTLLRPPWIKNYTALLHKDEYLDLSPTARALLHMIWLAYADRAGRLRVSDLPRVGANFARNSHIEALNHAGFIRFSSRRPLTLTLEVGSSLPTSSSKGRGSGGRDAAAKRRRVAEIWLEGPGREVPESQLATILREDLKITDPDMLAQLLARAQEFR
jgi:hypothetical protein